MKLIPYANKVLSASIPPLTLVWISEIFDCFDLFEKYPPIDIPFHAIAGILVARGIDMLTVSKLKTRWILGWVTIVGIIWEIYEYMTGVTGSGLNQESMKDLLVDIAWAYLYCFYRDEKKLMTE